MKCRCTICLAEYQEREVLRIMPNCGHSFHLSCIDIWLRKQSTCPVCRLSVQNTFETKHARATTLAESQSFDSSEIMAEHSQQWLLPTLEHSGGNRGTSHGNADHPSIDLNLGVSSAAMPRSWPEKRPLLHFLVLTVVTFFLFRNALAKQDLEWNFMSEKERHTMFVYIFMFEKI